MDEKREGFETAPQNADIAYPEPAPAARRWARTLKRDLHGNNKRVVTPRGVYRSAAQAADAHGYSRNYGADLARENKNGWRWFVPGVDEGEPRSVRGRSTHKPVPVQAKRVYTPDGVFDSATLAGTAHGITRAQACRRAKRGIKGWSYEPTPLVDQ